MSYGFNEPAPPSLYKADVIPLTEGLDFNTATSLSKSGTLRDCMNYELVDGSGLRRIDGFRPYDGTALHNRDKLFVLNTGTSVASNAVFATPAWLYIENATANPNKVPFGQIFWYSTTLPGVGGTSHVPLVRLNCPSYADPLFTSGVIKVLNSSALSVTYSPGDGLLQSIGEVDITVYTAITGATSKSARNEKFLHGTSPSVNPEYVSFVSNHLLSNSTSQAVPSCNVEVWAEELKGVLYSIGDAIVVTGTSAKQIYPGDYIYGRTSGVDSTIPWLVLKSTLVSGTWSSGTARIEAAPLIHHVFTSGSNDTAKVAVQFFDTNTSLRLYRDSGADALSGLTYHTNISSAGIEDKAEVAVVYSRHSEPAAMTADSVYGTDSRGIIGGTGHRLSWNSGTPDGCAFTASGDAEFMPLIASGVIKSVLTTKQGDSYNGTGTVTYSAGTGGASGTNTTYRSNCIERVYPRFVHTGWIVPFDAGDKASGKLNKLNRYKDSASTVYGTASIANTTCSLYVHSIIDSSVPHTGASNLARIFNDQWKTTSGSATDSDSIVSAVSTDNGTTITNSYDWGRYPTSSIAFTSTSGFIGFSGLDGVIPDDSIITGISFSARIEVTASANSATIYTNGGAAVRAALIKNHGATVLGSPLEMLSASGSLKDTWSAATMAETVFTAGGSTNLWGNRPLKLEDVLDPTFGVGFDICLERADSSLNPTGTFVIDQVTMTVTYELPSVRLYFTDTANGTAANTVIRGDVIDYVVSTGSFENGDAAGFMTVVNLSTITAGAHTTSTFPYYTIQNDYYVYQDAALTTLVARTSGEMEFNSCDPYRSIKAEGSLYTSVRGNVYANADYDVFFICSGAGRAKIFDGRYLTKVYAINPRQENSEALDKPRHCAIKDFSLFLGYEAGEVTFSAPGDPSNFSAFDGAGTIGIGDNVTGLQNMPGASLCVACRNSMNAIVGSSALDYSVQTLVADEGAFEYSVAPAGGRVLYMTYSGITTLDQSNVYGNFVGRRLSFKVNPWLLPRINSVFSSFQQPTITTPPYEGGAQFQRAHAVPYKNQYRVYFKDGTQLWMTLLGDQGEFTFVKYHAAAGDSPGFYDWSVVGPIYPLYITTTVEKDSYTPYKTICTFDPESLFRGRVVSSSGSCFGVYHLDAGDYFCSQGQYVSRAGIPHYAAVNYNYLQNPFGDKTIRKVRLEGQTSGYAPLTVWTKDGYLSTTEEVVGTGTPISLPSEPLSEMLAGYLPRATMANVASTGRVITILIAGRDTDAPPNGSTLVDTPPVAGTTSHHLQALFVQYEEGKQDA